MTEQEKRVNECIDNLEQQIRWIEDIDTHKFSGWGHTVDAMKQAVVLLKAQENEPVPVARDEKAFFWYWRCGACGVPIAEGDKYCRLCGRALKWE